MSKAPHQRVFEMHRHWQEALDGETSSARGEAEGDVDK